MSVDYAAVEFGCSIVIGLGVQEIVTHQVLLRGYEISEGLFLYGVDEDFNNLPAHRPG